MSTTNLGGNDASKATNDIIGYFIDRYLRNAK